MNYHQFFIIIYSLVKHGQKKHPGLYFKNVQNECTFKLKMDSGTPAEEEFKTKLVTLNLRAILVRSVDDSNKKINLWKVHTTRSRKIHVLLSFLH